MEQKVLTKKLKRSKEDNRRYRLKLVEGISKLDQMLVEWNQVKNDLTKEKIELQRQLSIIDYKEEGKKRKGIHRRPNKALKDMLRVRGMPDIIVNQSHLSNSGD